MTDRAFKCGESRDLRDRPGRHTAENISEADCRAVFVERRQAEIERAAHRDVRTSVSQADCVFSRRKIAGYSLALWRVLRRSYEVPSSSRFTMCGGAWPPELRAVSKAPYGFSK